jgi:hypothetical protein
VAVPVPDVTFTETAWQGVVSARAALAVSADRPVGEAQTVGAAVIGSSIEISMLAVAVPVITKTIPMLNGFAKLSAAQMLLRPIPVFVSVIGVTLCSYG